MERFKVTRSFGVGVTFSVGVGVAVSSDSGRLIPVPREISASCGLSWAVLQEEKGCLELVEREFAEEIEGKWMLDV